MHILMEPPKCSKCGSQNNETFQRGPFIHGTRCLGCGHEQVVTTSATDHAGSVAYSKTPGPREF